MRKLNAIAAVMLIIFVFSCKEKQIDREPGYLLQKWARSIEKLDYSSYLKCEAYPKSHGVFLEIYKNDYFTDMTVIEATDPDNKNIREDYRGDPYVSRKVTFAAAAVKRGKAVPYQSVIGDVELYKFLEGDRSKSGWLISNRTITRVNK